MTKIEVVEMVGGGYGIKRGYDPHDNPLYILRGDIVDIELKNGKKLENERVSSISPTSIIIGPEIGIGYSYDINEIKSIIDRTYDLKNQKYQKKTDMVNHPPHYQSSTGIEVIDVIKAFTENLTGIEATDTGNILRYICRWKDKNGLQDLEKCRWYINHLIEEVKSKEAKND